MWNFSTIAFRKSFGQKVGREVVIAGGFGQIRIRFPPSFKINTGGKHVGGGVGYQIVSMIYRCNDEYSLVLNF
jgi:hypothetical protein